MQTILVPTDFSATAEKAFLYALDIASKTNGTIILYHAYLYMESVYLDNEQKRNQLNSESESILMKKMEELKLKLAANFPDVPVSVSLGHEPLTGNLLAFAKENHAQLVVMGTHGASGLKRAILGSVAGHVLANSNIPVLLVPEKFEWKLPEKIVYATNYQHADREALTMVLDIAKHYHITPTILHLSSVYASPEEKEADEKEFDNYAAILRAEFSESNMNFELLETDSIIETMETLQNKYPYDLLAMASRKKNFFQKYFTASFTQNMAYITEKPLLVIPDI